MTHRDHENESRRRDVSPQDVKEAEFIIDIASKGGLLYESEAGADLLRRALIMYLQSEVEARTDRARMRAGEKGHVIPKPTLCRAVIYNGLYNKLPAVVFRETPNGAPGEVDLFVFMKDMYDSEKAHVSIVENVLHDLTGEGKNTWRYPPHTTDVIEVAR